MIELGDDVVDLNFDTRCILIRPYENKNLFKQAMDNHLKGTGYPCRVLMDEHGKWEIKKYQGVPEVVPVAAAAAEGAVHSFNNKSNGDATATAAVAYAAALNL